MLPHWAREDLGAMEMKGAPYSPKPQHYWNLTIRLFSVISRTLFFWGGSYPSAEVQSVYSTAPAAWAKSVLGYSIQKCHEIAFILRSYLYFYVDVSKSFFFVDTVLPNTSNFKTDLFATIDSTLTSTTSPNRSRRGTPHSTDLQKCHRTVRSSLASIPIFDGEIVPTPQKKMRQSILNLADRVRLIQNLNLYRDVESNNKIEKNLEKKQVGNNTRIPGAKQTSEAASFKRTVIRPLTSHLINYLSKTKS